MRRMWLEAWTGSLEPDEEDTAPPKGKGSHGLQQHYKLQATH